MATSSTTSSTGSVTTSAIDVASIVSQLMVVENKPLDAITAKITGIQTKISDLGTIKGKIASLQSALQTFEDPSTYNNPVAQSGDASIVTAKASGSATVGSIGILVNQIATASSYALHKSASSLNGVTSYTNFPASNSTLAIDADHPFSLTVGGQTYSTATTSIVGTGASGAITLTDLASWINALGAKVSASTVQTGASSGWVLQIQGTDTGAVNEVSNVGISAPSLTSSFTAGTAGAPATQAITFNVLNSGESITVGGLTFTANTGLNPAQVAAVFSDLSAGATTKAGVTTGTYSGALSSGWDSGSVTGTSTVGFTAKTNGVGTAITSSVGTVGVATSSFTSGSTSAAAIQTFTFNSLRGGESITVGGLTFTATTGLSAASVAAAFSNLSAGTTTGEGVGTGTYSGTFTADWSAGPVANTSDVTFTARTNGTGSAIAYSSVANRITGNSFTAGTSGAPATQAITFNALNSGESITVGGLTFTANTSLSAANVAAAFSSLSAGATTKAMVTTGTYSGALLSGWDSGSVTGTSTVGFTAKTNAVGTAITFSAGNGTSNIETLVTAQDAKATIGGLSVTRSSNKISDVVNGITFNLTGKSTSVNPTIVTVSQGADNSNSMITTLMQAYNDMVTSYNKLTANSSNSATPGTFANDPAMLSFVNNIKAMFAYGATDAGSASITGYTSTSQTISLNADGYIKVGSVKYSFSGTGGVGTTSPTVNQFVSWINSLKAGVNANFDGKKINIQNDQVNTGFTVDFSGLNATVTRSTTSLASLGLDIQLDGTMQFNTASYQKSVATGLLAKLAKGLKVGYSSETSSLDSFIKAQIDNSKGALVSEINQQQDAITRLQEKKADLQDHINQVQNNYISQYSALNALLFQLSSTSTSLASALTAITNINAGK